MVAIDTLLAPLNEAIVEASRDAEFGRWNGVFEGVGAGDEMPIIEVTPVPIGTPGVPIRLVKIRYPGGKLKK